MTVPKLNAAPAAAVLVAAAGAVAAVRPEHRPADHMVFINADGTRSRICICACDECWPPSSAPCEWSV